MATAVVVAVVTARGAAVEECVVRGRRGGGGDGSEVEKCHDFIFTAIGHVINHSLGLIIWAGRLLGCK